jgi:hypothetical protein
MDKELNLQMVKTYLNLSPDGNIVGYFEIGDAIHLDIRERPSKWNQWWIKKLLGWTWHDLKGDI